MKQRIGEELIGTMTLAVAGVLISGYVSKAAEKEDGGKRPRTKSPNSCEPSLPAFRTR